MENHDGIDAKYMRHGLTCETENQNILYVLHTRPKAEATPSSRINCAGDTVVSLATFQE